jgi:hypothetical protein
MKLWQVARLSIYFYGVIWCGQLLSCDQNNILQEIYAAENVIKKIGIDLNDYQEQQDHSFIVDITVIFIEMYEKIVGVTVTYCLMMHNPVLQQNLHDEVGRIIAQDMIKVFAILAKQCVYFILNKKMSLQEKIWHCGLVVSIIILIKLGIDQIPQSIKPKNRDENNNYNLQESGYVTGKFENYK